MAQTPVITEKMLIATVAIMEKATKGETADLAKLPEMWQPYTSDPTPTVHDCCFGQMVKDALFDSAALATSPGDKPTLRDTLDNWAGVAWDVANNKNLHYTGRVAHDRLWEMCAAL